MQKILLALIICFFSQNSYATDFSATGTIDGTQSANFIVNPGGRVIVFGAGYNTTTYQNYYSVSNLTPFYSPNAISVPSGFTDAANVPSGQYDIRPYSIYNIVVKGAGLYSFQVTDPAHAPNWTGSTIDLMAALYVTAGNATAFDSNNTLTNLVALNDDVTGGANPYPLFYYNSSATDCMSMSLVYFPWGSISGSQNVQITASGPGQIANACSSLGPSTADTQASLETNASALQAIYNLQSSIINNGLSYDCALFDVHGLCLSTGGRYSNTNTPTGDSAGALVIGAYRLNEQVRVGVYLDQGGVSNSLPSGLHLKQGNPLFGAFLVWQANQDGLGAQIKLATGYDEANLSVTRAVVGTSEAGTGTTKLSSQALSLVGSLGFEMQGGWLATPYAGLRRSQVKADGYTESDAIDAPLTYGKLKQAATTLQLGVKASANLSSQMAVNGSLGIEHDTNNNQGVYSASGVDNLTAIVFNSNINKTRPVASLGATFSVDYRQQLAFNLMYREEAFSHSSSTSAYGTYTIGF
jgi:uncharacterized protein YhjY with autotransporter beta-barrel domain